MAVPDSVTCHGRIPNFDFESLTTAWLNFLDLSMRDSRVLGHKWGHVCLLNDCWKNAECWHSTRNSSFGMVLVECNCHANIMVRTRIIRATNYCIFEVCIILIITENRLLLIRRCCRVETFIFTPTDSSFSLSLVRFSSWLIICSLVISWIFRSAPVVWHQVFNPYTKGTRHRRGKTCFVYGYHWPPGSVRVRATG